MARLSFPAAACLLRTPAGLVLTTRFIDQAEEMWLRPEQDRADPSVALVLRDLSRAPAGLAPAYVATAGLDPLRDEGEQYAAAPAAFVQQQAFALTEAGFALDLEDGAHVHAAVAFDFLIEIDERQAIMRGKPSPDRRLAGAGRTDDEKVVRRIHAQMLTGRIRQLW